MYVERLLQVNVAVLVTLGAVLLGMSQGEPLLPLGMLIAAFVSVWLTDVAGWFRLNWLFTNVAAAAAFVIFLGQVTGLSGVVRVLAIGNLLVFLQIILLLQKKDARAYWLLILLSLLEVVVAAIFQQKLLFGLVLLAYLFVALSALAILFLHRERTRHRAAGESPAPALAEGRWPLAGRAPDFGDSNAGYGGPRGVARELRRRVAGIGVGSLLLALVVFFIFPRWGNQPWRGAMAARRHAVGYSDAIRLGELGKILEDPAEVLRVELLDAATQEPYEVRGELYLRGSVLTRYQQGRWSHPGRGVFSNAETVPLAWPAPAEARVIQRITIEPLDRPELFCVWPFANLREGQSLLFDPDREVLLRPNADMGRRLIYELATPAFRGGLQESLMPRQEGPPLGTLPLLEMPPVEVVPGLVAKAAEWVREVDPADHFAVARVLERQLAASRTYQYSLEGQPRDPALDPIEDFITTHPRGHCEYFATALVLMLRSREIPARMIVGYKTDEWNRLGRFFQVRQLHTHTWVEAYLEPGKAGRPLVAESPARAAASGAWLRLDPTPGGQSPRVNPVVDAFGSAFDWLDFLWANYVLELDRPRQRETIYDPLADSLLAMARRLVDPDWWRSVLGTLAATLGTGLWNLVVGLAAALGLVALIATAQFARLAWRTWRWRYGRDPGRVRRSGPTRVEFYRRLERLLARLGLTRAPWQTQREFALEAGRTLLASTGRPQLAGLPEQITEAFYDVRFGATALDNCRVEAVERALAMLAGAGLGTQHVSRPSGEDAS
jgi:hypothetical protein